MRIVNRSRVAAASLATAAALAWWIFLIDGFRSANWSSMYLTGSRTQIPEALRSENIYLFPDSPGYDGQFYHFIAHDPWLARGFQSSVDAPRMRWRRILMSAVAWGLAGGRDAWIDGAFYALVFAWLWLGAWWSGAYLEARGAPAWWGGAFLATPAALISLDRIVTDLALTALAAGVFYCVETGRHRGLWWLLAAAVLARETGLLLVAGCAGWMLWGRQWRRAAVLAASALPGLAWWLYVARRASPETMPGWGVWLPMTRPIQALLHPIDYPFPAPVARFIVTFDFLALAGSLLAIALALAAAWRRRDALRFMLPAFGLFGLLLSATASLDVFQDVFSHARLLSPLILLLAADGAARRDWLGLAPLVLTALRIGLPLASQGLAILRGVHP